MRLILGPRSILINFRGILKRRLSGLAGNHATSQLQKLILAYLGARTVCYFTKTDENCPLFYLLGKDNYLCPIGVTQHSTSDTYQAKIIIFGRYLLGKDNYLCPIGVTQHSTSDPSGKDNYLCPIG